jgi:hypothetical protein
MKKEMVNSPVVWKVIEDFPLYEISNEANVRRLGNENIRKTPVGKRGYPVLSLRKDGKTHICTLHRLLAKAFIPNPNNLREVNHKDGDKTNCSIENLEWCTSRENNVHARTTGLRKSDGDKAVLQFSKEGILIAEYKSVAEAARQTGISKSAIGNVCANRKNRRGYHFKTCYNFIWKWKN